MSTATNIFLVTASVLLMAGTAVANEGASSNYNAAPIAQTEQKVPVHYNVKPNKQTPKHKMRIVREPLPAKNSATGATTQRRFVIGADSRDNIIIYKSAKPGKTMPNLFKN